MFVLINLYPWVYNISDSTINLTSLLLYSHCFLTFRQVGSTLWSYLAQFLIPSLKIKNPLPKSSLYFRKMEFSGSNLRNFVYFSKRKIFLYFGKRKQNFLIFLVLLKVTLRSQKNFLWFGKCNSLAPENLIQLF